MSGKKKSKTPASKAAAAAQRTLDTASAKNAPTLVITSTGKRRWER